MRGRQLVCGESRTPHPGAAARPTCCSCSDELLVRRPRAACPTPRQSGTPHAVVVAVGLGAAAAKWRGVCIARAAPNAALPLAVLPDAGPDRAQAGVKEILTNQLRTRQRFSSMVGLRLSELLSTKWIVSGAAASTLAYRRDLATALCITGAVVNGLLSKILKRILRRPRPSGAPLADPGMPSSHAMSLFYFATYLLLALTQLSTTTELNLAMSLSVLLAVSFSHARTRSCPSCPPATPPPFAASRAGKRSRTLPRLCRAAYHGAGGRWVAHWERVCSWMAAATAATSCAFIGPHRREVVQWARTRACACRCRSRRLC